MTMPVARWPWVLCGVLLISAAGIAAWSNWVNWLPCRGSMLLGSHLGGPRPGGEFTDACLDRMDNGSAFPIPGTPALLQREATIIGLVAQLLVVAAWLVLICAVAQRSRRSPSVLLVAPAVALVVMDLVLVLPSAPDLELWAWIPALGIEVAAAFTATVLGATARSVGAVRRRGPSEQARPEARPVENVTSPALPE